MISAARVVLPVPPTPYTTIPASCGLARSAGQRRCSRRRPTKYQSSRAASPAIRGRDGCDTAGAVRPGSSTGTDPDAARTVTAAHSPRPASLLSRLSGEVSSSAWTWRRAEKELYDAVTAYVNTYLGASATGGRGSAVALARTVLQRRLASSLGAIRSSLAKRAGRLADRADELERMTPAERRRRLAELGSMPKVSDDTDGDPEIGFNDVDPIRGDQPRQVNGALSPPTLCSLA